MSSFSASPSDIFYCSFLLPQLSDIPDTIFCLYLHPSASLLLFPFLLPCTYKPFFFYAKGSSLCSTFAVLILLVLRRLSATEKTTGERSKGEQLLP